MESYHYEHGGLSLAWSLGGKTSYPIKVLYRCLCVNSYWFCSSFVQQTAGIGFSAACSAFIFYYNCLYPMERELVWKIPNVTVPILVAVVSIGSIIFGWFPGVGHWPHLTGGLAGWILMPIFRKGHKSLEEEEEVTTSELLASVI
ncbi:hypothetical protein GEMRC1_003593 [Eukaryota sp. GEM-RC1]